MNNLFDSSIYKLIYSITIFHQTDLKKNNIQFEVFPDVRPEPKRQDFESAISLAKSEQFDVIVGFGGGSCIDFAKALSICSTHRKDVWEFVNLSNRPPAFIDRDKVLPIISVPTTAGTGSEVTPYSVVINNETLQEGTIKDLSIVPKVAIVDPGLMRALPKDWTAITGIDAFSHALESFFNKARRNEYSDMICVEAMKSIFHYLPRAFDDGNDLKARSGVAYGATLAGMAISIAGTTVGHALAHPTDARVGTPHGVSVGFYLLPVLKHTIPFEWERFSTIADIFGEKGNLTGEDLSWKGVENIETFLSSFNQPRKLSDYNVSKETLTVIVDDALKYMFRPIKQHPKLFHYEELLEIVNEAY